MAEHSGMSKAEEQFVTRRRAEGDSAAEHVAEASYLTTLLRHPNLGGHANSGTRGQILLGMQRTHGNRAVQRLTCEELNKPGARSRYTDGELVQMMECHKLERTIPQIVQDHMAEVQGRMSFIEDQQAKEHDRAIDDAQRAITGLPTDWPAEYPRTLEQPQYDDVSPALNPWELQEAERQREMEDSWR